MGSAANGFFGKAKGLYDSGDRVSASVNADTDFFTYLPGKSLGEPGDVF